MSKFGSGRMRVTVELKENSQAVFVHTQDASCVVSVLGGCVAIRYGGGGCSRQPQTVCIFIDDPKEAALLGDELIQASSSLQCFLNEQIERNARFSEVRGVVREEVREEVRDGAPEAV